MRIGQLVLKEIRYRKLNFALGCISVTVAVTCMVSVATHLAVYDAGRLRGLQEKFSRTVSRMTALEDDYRKITKGLGFNVQVLPRSQDVSEFLARGHGSVFMPEAYVHTLAEARDVVTVQHLLPILQQRVRWPERMVEAVNLIGTRAEVPFAHRDPRKPMLDAVEAGTMVLGFRLHKDLGIAEGAKVVFMGKEFTVARCHEERGTADDISVWIHLGEAQEMLGRQGQINAILALSCQCEESTLEGIRREITGILPETQVLEFVFKAEARRQARERAARAGRESLDEERLFGEASGRHFAAFAAVLAPLVAAGCFVWIGFLALANVRERRQEIGILRALGFRTWDVIAVFLLRAALAGLAGGVLGYAAGMAGAWAWEGGGLPPISPVLAVLAILAAPVLSMLAAWLPALAAAQQDPAVVLREE